MSAALFAAHLLVGAAITAFLFGVGLLGASLWRPPRAEDDTPIHHVLIALGIGFGLVPFVAFAIVLFPDIALTAEIPVGVGLILAVGAGLALRRRGLPVQLKEGWAEARPVLIAAGLVGLVYLLKYDRSVCFLESCIHRVVIQVLKLHEQDVHLLYSNRDDQRLGNPAVISGFVVLYRGLGFRVLYGFLGFAMALGGWALGRRVFGSARWAWVMLLALPLNPYVFKIPLLDENLLTLGFSSLLFPLLLRRHVPWAIVGLFYGLVVMMQHAAILSGLAMVVAIAFNKDPSRPWHRAKAFAVAFPLFVLVTLVCHIHHYLALGSLLRFESFGQIPAFPHRFFGMYEGLLQWPFGPELVRTPWNPFPTFLMWPVYLMDLIGAVPFAGIAVGLAWQLWRARQDAALWLAWFVLPYLALSLQENWDVPNKMGVIYMCLHPLLVWAITGVRAVFEGGRAWGVSLAVLSFAVGASAEGLRHLDVPVDTRYYVARFGERREDPTYVRAERELVTDVAPWPDYSRVGPVDQVIDPAKLRTLVQEIVDPTIDRKGTPYGWFPDEQKVDDAPSVVLEVDLRARPVDGGPLVRLAEAGPVDLDLSAAPAGSGAFPTWAIPDIRVSWAPRPVTVLASGPGAAVTGLYLLFEPWGEGDDRREYLQDRYHRGLRMVLGWPDSALFGTRSLPADTDGVFRVRVPHGPFSLVESVNNSGQLYYAWQGVVSEAGVLLDGPRKVFHN